MILNLPQTNQKSNHRSYWPIDGSLADDHQNVVFEMMNTPVVPKVENPIKKYIIEHHHIIEFIKPIEKEQPKMESPKDVTTVKPISEPVTVKPKKTISRGEKKVIGKKVTQVEKILEKAQRRRNLKRSRFD